MNFFCENFAEAESTYQSSAEAQTVVAEAARVFATAQMAKVPQEERSH
jgi:hypothetical protein